MSERRGYDMEVRAKGRRLEGYAALFGTEARLTGMRETIAPGAFSGSLGDGSDILALVDHDPARVMGRTRSGSLRLAEDTRGLAFDLDLPDTQAGRDVLTLAERGDLGGMSFGFTATDERMNGDLRELRAVTLYEISVVCAWPAYDGTIVQARSLFQPCPHRDHAARVLRLAELSQWA